jgi:ribonuclease P protein component
MPALPRLTFSKQERLRGKTRIESLVKQGKAVNEPSFRLIGLPMDMPAGVRAQIGFAVPKRNLRLAVDRNRTKRRMREAYRLQKPMLMAHLAEHDMHCAWLLIYQGRAVPTWEVAQRKITRCLNRWLEEHG